LTPPYHIIGASGRSGAALWQRLHSAGHQPVAVIRCQARWAALGLPGNARIADLTDALSLRAALADARIVISCAHARHAPAILAAAPSSARFVFLGSTRKFTQYPEAHGNGVLAGEAAFLASGRSGVMLHPTMIYGAQGEDNVQRLASLLTRLPIVPLPGGGASLVQPIYQGDVTASIMAALARDWDGPHALTIAGPSPMPYARFVRAIAYAAGIKPPRIVPVPAALLIAGSWLTRLPGLPTIRAAEIRRLLEDKAFDVAPMRDRLGIVPRGLAEGLALTFRKEGVLF
jgi:nucleoside-diphosphate-sugar epimerase